MSLQKPHLDYLNYCHCTGLAHSCMQSLFFILHKYSHCQTTHPLCAYSICYFSPLSIFNFFSAFISLVVLCPLRALSTFSLRIYFYECVKTFRKYFLIKKMFRRENSTESVIISNLLIIICNYEDFRKFYEKLKNMTIMKKFS